MVSAAEEAARDEEVQDLFIDPCAMYRLAVHYLGSEWGSVENPSHAIYWLRRAAALDFAPAVFELGECYRRGFGVPANELLACGQYQRCMRLSGFSDLSYDQRKTVEKGAAHLEHLKREAAVNRWQKEEALLRKAFVRDWRWLSTLQRMVPSLICCLADQSRFKNALVSAAVYRDVKTKTIVIFVNSPLDWIGQFPQSEMFPSTTGEIDSNADCRMVWPETTPQVTMNDAWPGFAPQVGAADISYGVSVRFLPTQQTPILFPWHSSRLDVFSDISRWILWSVVDDCPCFARGFDSYVDIHAYQNRTFPWLADDFPLLMAKPDKIKHYCIHNPLRDNVGEFSDFYRPDCMPNLELDPDTQREPESKKCLAADIDDRGFIVPGDCGIKCNGEWPVGQDGREDGDYWCPYDGRWTQCPNYCGPRI